MWEPSIETQFQGAETIKGLLIELLKVRLVGFSGLPDSRLS